jgi:hypothetical protein
MSEAKPERNWWDKAKPFVEIAGILLLAVYTGFTVGMYFANREAADAAKSAADTASATLGQIQQQTALTKQQLASIKGARCDITMGIHEDDILYIQANSDPSNQGRVDVLNFDGSFQIARTSMRTGKVSWKSEPIKLHKAQIASGMSIATYEKVADLSPKDKQFGSLENLTETIIVSGQFQYEDGFGDIAHDSTCIQFIGLRLDNGQYRGITPVPCNEVPLMLSRYEHADAKGKRTP